LFLTYYAIYLKLFYLKLNNNENKHSSIQIFKYSSIYAMIFSLSLLISSCHKESPEKIATLEKNMITSNRTTEDVRIQNVQIDGCCITAEVRTNIEATSEIPIHSVGIFKTNFKNRIATVIHGGMYGGNWNYDPNGGDYKYYWILEYCFEGESFYCLASDIIGFNSPPPVGQGGLVNISQALCFEITDCEPTVCGYYTCWEEFALHLETFTSMIVSDQNGSTATIYLEGIESSEGFNALFDIIEDFLDGENNNLAPYTGSFEAYRTGYTCTKAGDPNYPTPGLFFVNSNYTIHSICGVDENEANICLDVFHPFCD